MMRYEQTGLGRIAGLGPELQELCKFQNVLVVQVSDEQIMEEDQGLEWLSLRYMDADNVAAQAIVLHCTLEPGSVRVRARYDDKVISTNGIHSIIERFSDIFGQIEPIEARQTSLKEIGASPLITPASTDCLFSAQHQDLVKYCGQVIALDIVQSEIGKHVTPGTECIVELVKPRGDHEIASLVAFIVTPNEEAKTDFAKFATALRSGLEAALPRHLIPAIFYPLEQKPISFDGRIDRRELQWLASSLTREELLLPSRSRGDVRGARSAVEEILADCWRRVLGTKDVGIDDNFIALGGDSVKVIRLIAAARTAGLELSVEAALKNQILRQMASCAAPVTMKVGQNVEPMSLIGGGATAKRLMPSICAQIGMEDTAVEDIVPCMPYQKHTFAMSLKTPGACVSQTCYHLQQDFDVDKFAMAWEIVCRDFSNLRTRVVMPPGHDLTLVVVAQHNPLEVTRHASTAVAESYFAKVRKSASSLGSPLAHATVVHIVGPTESDKRSFFVWSMNHTIYDGHTVGKMTNALHEAYCSGRIDQELAPYRHFAGFVAAKNIAASKIFWKQYLQGAARSTFPTYPSKFHRPRPTARQDYTVELVRKSASPITTATILKVAWGMTVGSYTATKDVTFQGLLSGRNCDLDSIDKITGPTLNYVPLRVPLAFGDFMPVPKFLARIQELDAEMISHQTLGLNAIAALDDETLKVCDFHNMLVIHSGEPEAPVRALLLEKYATSMDLTGFLGLFTQCTIMPARVKTWINYDEDILSASMVQDILAKFRGFIESLSSEEDSITIGELRRTPMGI
ncbi:hypothetical protein P7C71_g1090, partial [Lecanoromycetidae sp. Uapishka_2]